MGMSFPLSSVAPGTDGDDVRLVHLLFRRQVDAAGGLRLVLDALHEDAVGDGHEPPRGREEAGLRSYGVVCASVQSGCVLRRRAAAMPRVCVSCVKATIAARGAARHDRQWLTRGVSASGQRRCAHMTRGMSV